MTVANATLTVRDVAGVVSTRARIHTVRRAVQVGVVVRCSAAAHAWVRLVGIVRTLIDAVCDAVGVAVRLGVAAAAAARLGLASVERTAIVAVGDAVLIFIRGRCSTTALGTIGSLIRLTGTEVDAVGHTIAV
jgi:hypothetical protein